MFKTIHFAESFHSKQFT